MRNGIRRGHRAEKKTKRASLRQRRAVATEGMKRRRSGAAAKNCLDKRRAKRKNRCDAIVAIFTGMQHAYESSQS